MEQPGICVPEVCLQDSDCLNAGYACNGGACCGLPGSYCGGEGSPNVACYPGTGSTCIPFIGAASLCCKPQGMACGQAAECCSQACSTTAHTCSPSGAFLAPEQ
jgi:hypothetical protein